MCFLAYSAEIVLAIFLGIQCRDCADCFLAYSAEIVMTVCFLACSAEIVLTLCLLAYSVASEGIVLTLMFRGIPCRDGVDSGVSWHTVQPVQRWC